MQSYDRTFQKRKEAQIPSMSTPNDDTTVPTPNEAPAPAPAPAGQDMTMAIELHIGEVKVSLNPSLKMVVRFSDQKAMGGHLVETEVRLADHGVSKGDSTFTVRGLIETAYFKRFFKDPEVDKMDPTGMVVEVSRIGAIFGQKKVKLDDIVTIQQVGHPTQTDTIPVIIVGLPNLKLAELHAKATDVKFTMWFLPLAASRAGVQQSYADWAYGSSVRRAILSRAPAHRPISPAPPAPPADHQACRTPQAHLWSRP